MKTRLLLLAITCLGFVVGCTSEKPSRPLLVDGSDRLPNVPGNPADTVFHCQLVDVDADQDPDAFIIIGDFSVSPPNSILKLWLNDGMGTFTEVSGRLPTGTFGSVRDCDIGDIDGDGDTDIACVASSGANFTLRNDGQGYFSLSPDLITAGLICQDIVLFDQDFDGDLDAVISGIGQNKVFENNGVGGYSLFQSFQPLSDDSQCACVGDFDGDGFIDVLIINMTMPAYVYKGTGSAFVFHTTLEPPTDAFSGAVGDMDNDGDLDLLVGGRNSIALFSNDGAGNFTHDPHQVSGPQEDHGLAFDIALCDIDLDGDPDAYVSFISYMVGTGPSSVAIIGGKDRIRLNNGSGYLHESPWFTDPFNIDNTVASPGDIDKDGDMDFLLSESGASRPTLVLNLMR
ncbi:MAG: FG-GAP repeat domain-containing protein [Planctomycetota bacterium]|jgi:hypothetical protein